MAHVRVNPEWWAKFRAGKPLAIVAAELGLDKGTVSRVDAGKALPGNKFIANALLSFPGSFGTLFLVVEGEDD